MLHPHTRELKTPHSNSVKLLQKVLGHHQMVSPISQEPPLPSGGKTGLCAPVLSKCRSPHRLSPCGPGWVLSVTLPSLFLIKIPFFQMAMWLTLLSFLLLWWRQSDDSVLFLKVWEGRVHMYGNILLLRSQSQKFIFIRWMYKGWIEGTVPTLQMGIWSRFNLAWTTTVILLLETLFRVRAYCTVISTGMSHLTTTQPFKVLIIIKSYHIYVMASYCTILGLFLCYLI